MVKQLVVVGQRPLADVQLRQRGRIGEKGLGQLGQIGQPMSRKQVLQVLGEGGLAAVVVHQ